ncbi:hypothetical protein ACF08M_03755 [Streptomyces sp. NPDC015032]
MGAGRLHPCRGRVRDRTARLIVLPVVAVLLIGIGPFVHLQSC